MEYTLQWLMENDGFSCECGRRHYGLLKDCIIGEDALLRLPEMVRKYNGTHPFVLCDRETYAAAGERACALLEGAEIPYTLHIIGRTRPAPDERIVGEAVMFCDAKCDLVIAVGGGVINDTGKILAAAKNCTDIYVAAAPSMDGYASASSSMEREGLKVSLNSKCPDAVIGDAAVLAAAPVHMIRSGIGDMAAKYISLVEWQIAALLVGDYYCPTVANIVKESLAVCAENAAAAVSGDREAVCRLAEGLVMSGLAMNYAGISRPASGMEHYISHILDMRALEFGAPADLHGIQCGIATLITAEAYELLAKIVPDREKALAYVKNFSLESWSDHLRALLGHGAQAMIAGEKKEGKYDPEKHAARLEKILANWETILEIVSGLPSAADLRTFFVSIGHPVSGGEIGLTSDDMRQAFLAAKDIRDKYVLGRLLWDLGELESTAEALCL
ncbi:MAG: iron-containing alcohol dehydrogenase [Clostridia bacterium]|nr:iron-containing alcohol dehydrogenase [Clostridia bacterium]